MGIQYIPRREVPEGIRIYQDVVREIEAADGLKCTGWHYGYEPTATEIEDKALCHEKCAPSELVARRIDTNDQRPGHDNGGWSLFRIVR